MKFKTMYLTKMPTQEQLRAIENLTNVEVSEVIYSSAAINVYSVQVLKLLEVKALLASFGVFIEEEIAS